MQLQLFPPAPHPQILFSFTLPVLPPTLPFPPAYFTQLQIIMHAEIEPPPSPYALDKAVWAVHLIEIVVFDLANLRVEVKMVDGAVMEWDMRGEELLLNSVMDDVEASKNEAEREQREAERKEQEGIAAAAAASYLPLSQPHMSISDAGHYESKASGGSKPMHRRSKSLFSSLLSALNLNSSAEPSPSTAEYRIGGRRKDVYPSQPPPAATTATTTNGDDDDDDDEEPFSYPAYTISALSTSEYTYPMRAQLATNDFPASKILRRRARSTLVDCFRRWIIPTVRERLQWGAFSPFDELADGGLPGEGVKWGKMSKASNAYADWACRSMISRCERALRAANAVAEGVEGLNHTQQQQHQPRCSEDSARDAMERESRRSSASSMLTSAISASSRASSSAEQVSDSDGTPLISPAVPPTPSSFSLAPSKSKRSSATLRHVATLKNALDRFKTVHEQLALEAINFADSHTIAMHALEMRGRRKAWSGSEGGGLCRLSPLRASSDPEILSPLALEALRKSSRANAQALSEDQEYGDGSSLWELSIPVVRSTLGEISDTWEDWQMEWEMEKEFGSEDGFDDEFPGIISEFDTSADSIDTGLKPKSGRRSDATSLDEDPTECGHSGFSDSSSSEDEMEPCHYEDIGKPSSSSAEVPKGKLGKAKRGRRTGVKARMGKYEDVRNELPPDPPLMALSPPPRGKSAISRPIPSGDIDVGSSPTYKEADNSRPPRPARPSRLHVPPAEVTASSHRREAASAAYPEFAQSRLDDTEAALFDEWDSVDDDDGVFGRPSSKLDATAVPCPSKSPKFQIFDGLGILEQVGGAGEGRLAGPNFALQNGVGIGYPPGLHGDLPSPPSSPTKRVATSPETPRRVSHYISRDLPPTGADTSTVHAAPLVMEKDTKRMGRPRPRLTLAFPDPPSYIPSSSEVPSGRGASSLPCSHPCQSTDGLNGNGTHVGSETTSGARHTCPSTTEKDSPALLLDTPTAEHPSSSYPYTWEVNILPPGVKVVGTVGVAPAPEVNEVVLDMPAAVETPGATGTSSGSSPFNAVVKVLSKVRKVKPVLYVTPPPPPVPSEEPAPIRVGKLGRSKSWKDLSVAGGLNFRAEIMKRRKSADAAPMRTHLDTEVLSTSSSQEEVEGGDKTILLEGTPCLSPTSGVSRTNSELEPGWRTPSLVSLPSSASSSAFSSLNSTATNIAEGTSPLETDSSCNGCDSYDGIVMAHPRQQTDDTVVPDENYSIQQGWFPRRGGSTRSSDEETVVAKKPEHLSSVLAMTTSACPVAGPGSTGPRKLRRANSATRPDRSDRPPPPPRPTKSLKRSLSLSTFGRKIDVSTPAQQ